jgi:2-hydroxychromene-2-carboxylate isomerase
LPELLVASFLAFEDIRLAARGCEDLVPELLATFMTAADAAVSGREAIAAAPSLARAIAARDQGSLTADRDVMKVIGALGMLGSLLSRRLADGAVMATAAADREACLDAAAAAGRVSGLMARDEG